MLKVTVDSYEQAKDCPFRTVLDKMGDKWSFLIFAVLEDGPKRFNEIKRSIGDISQRVLTKSLRDLERDGYLSRTVYPESPPRVEYELTDLGHISTRASKGLHELGAEGPQENPGSAQGLRSGPQGAIACVHLTW